MGHKMKNIVRPKTEIGFDLKNIGLFQDIFRHFQLG